MYPTSEAAYTYDTVGNRTSMTTDYGTVRYTYDDANRVLSDGQKQYSYDADGNLIKATNGNYEVNYGYTPSGMLERVEYGDGSYVAYEYDAFGRKTSRTEAYYKENSGNNSGSNSGNNSGNGNTGFIPPGQLKESKSNGNGGNSIKNGSGATNGNGKNNSNGSNKNKPLKIETDETRYLYDGFGVNVLNEYTGNGSPLGEYYYANNSIVSKKMFGNHGLDGRGPDLKTTGGLMYYHYDGLRNVSTLTDRHGDVIEDYRYDVFGNIYTGITAPYNTFGYTGQQYDPKAGLVDMHSRWYAPNVGRFTTEDSYYGDLLKPHTQNRYAYVGNNPVNRWDPLGYAESDMRDWWSETNDYGTGYTYRI